MVSKRRLLFFAFLIAAMLIPVCPALAGEEPMCEDDYALCNEFPLRPYYPEVPTISTESLLNTYNSIVIVDIRSSFEYDVARINKAELLPLTDPDFTEKLEKIRPKAWPSPMAFYCNGHSCAKSYKAAQLALSLGFTNVYSYDGGIFDWIMAAPDKATLMGETPARADRIISNEEFARRLLDFETFASQGEENNTVVIDIRDPFQRELKPNMPGIRNIPLDPLLDLVVSRIWTEKRLLFLDAVGKQVRWLQYFLESYGYFDYAFLKGGVRGLASDKQVPVIETNRSIISDQTMLLTITADTRLNNSDRKVLSYLIGNVKFNNYIVVDMPTTTKELGMSKTLLLNSIKKMTRFKYLNHSIMQDSIIAQVDPLLAWKGKVNSDAWEDASTEFHKLVGK